MEIRQMIKDRREALGISQTELALRVGYKDKSTIAKIESGQRGFPVSKVRAFAKALQLQPVDLIGQDDDLADLGNRLIPEEFALLVAFRSADHELRREVLRMLGVR